MNREYKVSNSAQGTALLSRVSPRDPPSPSGAGAGPRRRFSLDLVRSAVDDPSAVHRSVLRLTYVIAPAVVVMSLLVRLLGVIIPVWLIVLFGFIMMAAAGNRINFSRGADLRRGCRQHT